MRTERCNERARLRVVVPASRREARTNGPCRLRHERASTQRVAGSACATCCAASCALPPLLPIRDDTPFIMMPARADNEEVRRSVAAEDAAAPPKSGVAAALPTESRMEAASLDSLPSRERWPGALPGNAGGPGEAGTLFLAGFG